jgi:subtilisin-like proprotein convertase family protein
MTPDRFKKLLKQKRVTRRDLDNAFGFRRGTVGAVVKRAEAIPGDWVMKVQEIAEQRAGAVMSP